MSVWNHTTSEPAVIRIHRTLVMLLAGLAGIVVVLVFGFFTNQQVIEQQLTAQQIAASSELESCFNGICEPELGEHVLNCIADCGSAALVANQRLQNNYPDNEITFDNDQEPKCSYSCDPPSGDGICCTAAGENDANCPFDCNPGFEPGGGDSGDNCDPDLNETCGNGVCECGESGLCPADCGDICGDQVCAASEITTCCTDCTVDITCGDGICGGCEQGITDPALWCETDCGPQVTPTNPATATPTPVTPTVTPSLVPVTPSSTPTITNTPEPGVPTATNTPEPTETPTPTATPEEVAECGLIDREEVDPAVVQAFEQQAEEQVLGTLYYVCPEPPEVITIPINNDLNESDWYGEVVEDYSMQLDEAPIYGPDQDWFVREEPGEILGFVELAVEDENRVVLYDCTTTSCNEYEVTDVEDDLIITVASVTNGEPQCALGCVYAISQLPVIVEPTGPRVPIIPILLILAGIILLSIFLFTRRRRDEDDEDDLEAEVTG